HYHHFRHHDSLRQSLRAAANQRETPAGLFEHRARGLFAAGRGRDGGREVNRRRGGDAVLSHRLSIHRARGFHGHHTGDAAFGHGGYFGTGRFGPTLAFAGSHNDARHGVARRPAAARRIFRKIPAAQIGDRFGPGEPWLLLPGIHGARGRGDFDLLLFRRGEGGLLGPVE